jgi:hypothetical protein
VIDEAPLSCRRVSMQIGVRRHRRRTYEIIKGSRLVLIEGEAPGLNWRHAGKVGRDLMNFREK